MPFASVECRRARLSSPFPSGAGLCLTPGGEPSGEGTCELVVLCFADDCPLVPALLDTDLDKAGDALELSHASSWSPISKCTDAGLLSFSCSALNFFSTSAEERLRFRLTCDEFFLSVVDEALRASFFRSVCEPSAPCALVSLCKPLADGTRAWPWARPPPTTCFCVLGLPPCCGGVVEGESVWLCTEFVDVCLPSAGRVCGCEGDCPEGMLLMGCYAANGISAEPVLLFQVLFNGVAF